MPNMQRITWNGIALHGGRCPVCGIARLRADALRLCGEAVRQDVDRDAGDHARPNDAARSSFPHGTISCRTRRPSRLLRRVPRRSPAGRGGRQDADEAKRAPRQRRARQHRSRVAAQAEWLKTRVDAELAFADKALAAAKTDEAKARAEDLKQKAAARPRNWGRSSTPARLTRSRSSTPPPPQKALPRRPRP